MAYKSIGTFDANAIEDHVGDPPEFFQAITDAGKDMHVMEVAEGEDPELWHDDYDPADGAWVEAGEFEDWYAAMDAASGFPEDRAVGVFDHGDAQAKLMVREDTD